ncbi:branched-chain amino acid aminotransferase [Curvivirga aplysinae]|uniref:branched-chain amino acid aminotransferase n=1 Tax=Curvivirga aplysinae TaxID=2529852 RepID=UPI0012BCB8DE|nr:branched-chain amino acid aminotransferase [Curvivirga aplysinae]MTI10740.1 branched-chain amino acid aminotransferase [Curvivirga aplysinae]
MDSTNAIMWTEGQWQDANTPIINVTSNSFWLASTVFDGARSFDGVAPDLDLHCQRAVRSAEALGLRATKSWEEIYALAWEGIKKFPKEAVLYIKPVFWADEGFIAPDPDSTRFALTLYEAPFPPNTGFSAKLSSYRRPSEEVAPTNAKAACLYPNAGRALQEAIKDGYNNAVMCDSMGNVAEFATANLFCVKDGHVMTPAPNGSFLNGITRQRVIALLKGQGIDVDECRVTPAMLEEADEIFSTGNYGKVVAVINYEGREMQPGPIMQKARDLYFEYAKKEGGE